MVSHRIPLGRSFTRQITSQEMRTGLSKRGGRTGNANAPNGTRASTPDSPATRSWTSRRGLPVANEEKRSRKSTASRRVRYRSSGGGNDGQMYRQGERGRTVLPHAA